MGDMLVLHSLRWPHQIRTSTGVVPDRPADISEDELAAAEELGEILSRSDVYRAVVKPRYRTLEHLRQIPADEVLARHEPEAALKILLDHCGRSTERWEALAAAMTFGYDEEEITFGQLLDSLPRAPRGADILTGRPADRCVRGASARADRNAGAAAGAHWTALWRGRNPGSMCSVGADAR
ncbi:hypothetical protein [Streptomyces albofaciens]|uniref:hypothetical protein n=1 Tax=Streptomyces albofaciens TaxID=66866 RepID=UPI000A947F5E|nr:hypothetical protein [Streptomyces albofaciens]